MQIKKAGMLAKCFRRPGQIRGVESRLRLHSQLTFLGRSVGETQLLLIVLYDSRSGRRSEAISWPYELGCVMENMWLMSQSLGIGSMCTVFSDGHVEKKVRNILHIPQHMKIAFACASGIPRLIQILYSSPRELKTCTP